MKLVRDSEDYLEYYAKKFDDDLNNLLPSTLKDSKCIILCVLKDHYNFFKTNSCQIVSRVLLCLSINPLNDFSTIDWTKFSMLRRLMTQKDFDMLSCVKFLINIFFQSSSMDTSKHNFEQVLRVIC
jgi:hypothetical protein